MAITEAQMEAAIAQQELAAHELSPQVRLVAGPGTGKSYAIGERIRWLLSRGISSDAIYAVSFTRAASRDLRRRIQQYCTEKGQAGAELVHVSTVHSLALSALRSAGFIEQLYPVAPQVLDQWECEEIFDAEFAYVSGFTPGRCKSIRRNYEAFRSTGTWNPANFIQPTPPVSEDERELLTQYRVWRTQTYACVLPGEIVRLCVERMNAGILDPVAELGIEHIIVDEFQDLNPIDIEFVYKLLAGDVIGFIAGDDDQSIYSFRFASPSGIQNFPDEWGDAESHALSACFRCTPTILDTAQRLIEQNPLPSRIPKDLTSLWENADPPVTGIVHYWRFANHSTEARVIAESCRDLTTLGIKPREILILIGNKRRLLSSLSNAFEQTEGVELETPSTEGFLDTSVGRFGHSILRLVCDSTDYVALRTFLGLLPRVGVATCNDVAVAVIENNLNYRDVFYGILPEDVFAGRALTAVNRLRDIVEQIADWSGDDTLQERQEPIADLLSGIFGQVDVQPWLEELAILPSGMNLEEIKNYLWADTDEQQELLLGVVYERLNVDIPDGGILPQKVRAMTMHGAKGLNADVVIIPGLEEGVIPNGYQRRATGLVLEAARQLYVSITRARIACIISFAQRRSVHGSYTEQAPSRFASQLGGPFTYRDQSLAPGELSIIEAYLREYREE